jgi:hypothetical protein
MVTIETMFRGNKKKIDVWLFSYTQPKNELENTIMNFGVR